VTPKAPKSEGTEPETEPGANLASKIGWALFAAGVAVVGYEGGSLFGAYGAAVLLGGTLLSVTGRFYRDRVARAAGLPTRPAPIAFPLGVLLMLLAFGSLLYPAFISRIEFRQLVAEFPYGPLVSVCLGFSGIAMLIDYLDRPAPADPPFRLPEPSLTRRLGICLLPFIYIWSYLHESWKEIDAEAERERAERKAAGKGYDWRPLVVFTIGAVLLGLMEYYGHAPALRDLIDHFDPIGRMGEPESIFGVIRDSPFRRLIEFIWWSGWRLFGFFLVPALVLMLMRERVSSYGLQTRGFAQHAWIYLGFYTLVLGTVIVVSYEDTFSTYYPFYSDASRSWYDFWAWEAIYAVQFFSLEFFFRGFWVKAGKTQMGSHAIYAMVVPYCMIHFGKPYLETNGAIIAGVVLGTLALRTRSIWAGFLIHVSVAISMDLAALMQTTGLPDQWWPDL